MKTFSRFLLSAGFALAISFTSSCSGDDGSDGKTPYIGANGNWFIDGKDTGVNAQGKDGKDGKDGNDGADGNDGYDGKDGTGGKDASPCLMEDFSGTQIKITCGEYVAFLPRLCGTEAYDSDKKFCDADKGIAYKFVEIGEQTWMVEDLKGGTANKFTWAEATADGVCPAGWKLPSRADFFLVFIGSFIGDFLDSWNDDGSWWISDEYDDGDAYFFSHNSIGASANNYGTKAATLSVRCLKD